MSERKIPVLTDVVTPPGAQPAAAVTLSDEEIAELQTRIATRGCALMEKLLHESLREYEANLFADVIGRLRAELPDLVDDALREHLAGRTGAD